VSNKEIIVLKVLFAALNEYIKTTIYKVQTIFLL